MPPLGFFFEMRSLNLTAGFDAAVFFFEVGYWGL